MPALRREFPSPARCASHAMRGKAAELRPTLGVLIFGGTVLPARVLIFGVSRPVKPYVAPTLQCQKCLLYSHPTWQCRSSTARCTNCCQRGHTPADCPNPTKCCHCGSTDHRATDKSLCPAYAQQRALRTVMAH